MPLVARSDENIDGPITEQYRRPWITKNTPHKLSYAGYYRPVLQDRYLGAPYYQPPNKNVTEASRTQVVAIRENLPAQMKLDLPEDGAVMANDPGLLLSEEGHL